MKILVGGSNQFGNDEEKERAIAILKKANHKVSHTQDIYRAAKNDREGNEAVHNVLVESDVFYVVCSIEGYTDFATAARLAVAYYLPSVLTYSSQELSESDLRFYVNAIVSPEELM